ncbi:GNAT family N-acetyltransferase [Arthrobacter zhangbolii]|uniref:GNAT family N-acetyltransferase n=1 Tax=Arthrobacter zhangbolii TaxID=2886936 RepID=A0A9X1M7Y8_9MICC|nr:MULTISPECIES: GNAT family N-acetyltransferase [Arthrobacter]MCC3272671.1 GNAT family N-acetyltransferase [Arthrobacter zhangbolii]MCC3295068.1 GNAT family N-acetyltransferase [Arthrobacter zhangbolii]MDN3903733.1 GNAT family N-acetyltransferase [Arthrobacter sp. YD2]UON91488.1 GNAT family N-acetyltransferase [Arthrobacter zhangbolii]
MNLDPGTIAIIQLAFSRHLGLADDALAATDADERIYSVREQSETVCFLRLFGTEVFSGPEWAAARARTKSAVELTRHSGLMQMSMEFGGRALGAEQLFFADAFPALAPLEDLAVANDPDLAVALERLCPPDDVAEAGLAGKEDVFVLVDDSEDDPRPVAGAGYSITDGILADMSVLTAPGHRLRGLGSYISSVALEDAMAGGLIPQWRAPLDNVGAARTAMGSGFIPAGVRTSVSLSA